MLAATFSWLIFKIVLNASILINFLYFDINFLHMIALWYNFYKNTGIRRETHSYQKWIFKLCGMENIWKCAKAKYRWRSYKAVNLYSAELKLCYMKHFYSDIISSRQCAPCCVATSLLLHRSHVIRNFEITQVKATSAYRVGKNRDKFDFYFDRSYIRYSVFRVFSRWRHNTYYMDTHPLGCGHLLISFLTQSWLKLF